MIPDKPIDKSTWGPGPWQDEPDRVEFEHAGFPCLLRRVEHTGTWCGYVGLPPTHRFYENLADIEVDVHGGLSYADHCHGSICHIPKEGEPDNLWWVGFDCCHGFDGMPAMKEHLTNEDNFFAQGYKDLAYVRKETEHLAEQLAAPIHSEGAD